MRSYAQNNPLYAYVQESAKLYQLMKVNIAKQVIEKLTAIVVTSDDLADDPLNDTEQLRVKVGG